MRFRKVCKRCGEEFIPEGKYCNFCIKCKKNPGNNVKERDSEIIRHRNLIKQQKASNLPTFTHRKSTILTKPIPIHFKSRKDLCPLCKKNQKLVVSNRCNECYHSNKHGQIARIKSLKEKKK